MTVARRLTTVLSGVTLALGSAVLSAAPASAIVPPADGVYNYVQEGLPAVTWKVQSICIQANGTRAQPDYTDETIQTLGCTVTINSITPQAPMTRDERVMTFGVRANLTGGRWTFQRANDEGFLCPDGSTAPATETFAFDAPDPAAPNPNVSGTRTTIHGAVCGQQPGMVKAPFFLTYVGPPDPPVIDRFPDNCNYLGGRPSICS
ncbi:MAG: hypothetical protein HYZ38_14990 [Mycobacterium sp.]|nr:hypothetical protein [Mycobacterium sp.]